MDWIIEVINLQSTSFYYVTFNFIENSIYTDTPNINFNNHFLTYTSGYFIPLESFAFYHRSKPPSESPREQNYKNNEPSNHCAAIN